MILKEYVEKENVNVCEMARKLEIHHSYLFMIITGKRHPSIHLARRIEDMTEGNVKVDELILRKLPPERCSECGKKKNRY